MVYTISIGSNEQPKENLELARKRLSELFPSICFSLEEETKPLFFRRPNLFSNQVARFMSDWQATEVSSHLKAIEREAGRTLVDKQQEIVRLDIDLLACDSIIYKSEDLKRDYIVRGLEQLPFSDLPIHS
ncbi:2-amino-4-hydroxy-6-hydroxymethyldihydropteridine diphosphokinase [uncultured Bacteroides sp.]|uniref:2-amino-4-hydroxy-6- hydroxymethyldihydropteridine diphosphokinase n=1 Tax=uncultured Bacteroides sp. TaxID=162156 RepID=UPI00263350A8|nr:2-amino-4-hydroxy-6-hydroxymethyldihydropteridine diphosphokinase [uncultured Bacteroides sp.]